MKKSLLLGLSLATLSAASFAHHKDQPHDVTVGPANWYAVETTKDRRVSADVAGFADVIHTHRSGWKGDGATLVTYSVNKADTAAFHSVAHAIAPEASHTILGNFVTPKDAITYGAFVTNDKNVSANDISGVSVSGYTNSNLVGVQASTYHQNSDTKSELTNHGNEAQFLGIHNVSANINDCQALKTAYLAGSAAIIAGKFPNLVAEEVVKNMNESRVDDKFSLVKSLSPKGTLR